MRIVILFLLLLTSSVQADAADCKVKFRTVLENIQSVSAVAGNLRKNTFATVFQPKALKNFDSNLFKEEKDRFLQAIKDGITEPQINFETAPFESKLAYLEVAMQAGDPSRSLLESLEQKLPPYQRKRLYKSIEQVLSGKKFTKAGIDYQIQNLYSDILEWHYPHVTDGVSRKVVEETLKNTARARFTSFQVAQTLKDLGLLNENPGEFQKFFEDRLKGQALQLAMNGEMNAVVIVGAHTAKAGLMGYAGIRPPVLKLNRFIEIPESSLIRASQEGFEKAWDEEMKPALLEKYKGFISPEKLAKTDIIYRHFQTAWVDATYYAFMGYLGYEAIKNAPKIPGAYREWRNNTEAADQFKELQKAKPSLNQEPTKDQSWHSWQERHPDAAKDSLGSEYKHMHRLIYGN